MKYHLKKGSTKPLLFLFLISPILGWTHTNSHRCSLYIERRHVLSQQPPTEDGWRRQIDHDLTWDNQNIQNRISGTAFPRGAIRNPRQILEDFVLSDHGSDTNLLLDQNTPNQFIIQKGPFLYEFRLQAESYGYRYTLVKVSSAAPHSSEIQRGVSTFYPPALLDRRGHSIPKLLYIRRWELFLKEEYALRPVNIEIPEQITQRTGLNSQAIHLLLMSSLHRIYDLLLSTEEDRPLLLVDYNDPRQLRFFIRQNSRTWIELERFFNQRNQLTFAVRSVGRAPEIYRQGLGPHLIGEQVNERRRQHQRRTSESNSLSTEAPLLDLNQPVIRSVNDQELPAVLRHIQNQESSENFSELPRSRQGLIISGCHTWTCWQQVTQRFQININRSDSFRFVSEPIERERRYSFLIDGTPITITSSIYRYGFIDFANRGSPTEAEKSVFQIQSGNISESFLVNWISLKALEYLRRFSPPITVDMNNTFGWTSFQPVPGLTITCGYEQISADQWALRTWFVGPHSRSRLLSYLSISVLPSVPI